MVLVVKTKIQLFQLIWCCLQNNQLNQLGKIVLDGVYSSTSHLKCQLPERTSCQLFIFRNLEFDLKSNIQILMSLNTKLYFWVLKAVLLLYSCDWMRKLFFWEMFCSAFSARVQSLMCNVTKCRTFSEKRIIWSIYCPHSSFVWVRACVRACVHVCVCVCMCVGIHMCSRLFFFPSDARFPVRLKPYLSKRKKGGVKSGRVLLWQTDI